MRRTIRYEAKDGARRTIRRFLWWPLTLDGECRWLEWAWISQHFRIFGWRGLWVNGGWVDVA